MMTSEHLKNRIEEAATLLNLAPSTIGERVGQGGRFYARLCEGKRVWPETAQSVAAKLDEMLAQEGAAE